MRFALLTLPFLLGGCASIVDAIAPPYAPEPIKIFDQAQYDSDLEMCRAAGTAYKPRFSFGKAISKTVAGATDNSSMIPLSPLVPVFGAAGGATSAAADGFDVMSREHANVFKHCLQDSLRRDGAAIIANPDN
jgi:hypothetical protein